MPSAGGGPVYESDSSRVAYNKDRMFWPTVLSSPGQLENMLDGKAVRLLCRCVGSTGCD